MPDTALQQSFNAILRDLDFHQSIISRTRGRWKKYPLRTFIYAVTNTLLKVELKLGRSTLITAKTFWGDKMLVVFPTYRSVYNFGILDSGELLVQKALVTYLKPGDTFVDIGANVGFYSLLASALVGPGGKVISFEPTPSTFEILQKNTAAKQNITLQNCALGATAGEATLADFGLFESGLNSLVRHEQGNLHAQKITVPVTTLDNYCKTNGATPAMLKIDTEGMELEVLRGAEETLRIAKPILILEVAAPEESEALLHFVFAHGYKGYVANERMELVPYDAAAHTGRINMVFVAE